MTDWEAKAEKVIAAHDAMAKLIHEAARVKLLFEVASQPPPELLLRLLGELKQSDKLDELVEAVRRT